MKDRHKNGKLQRGFTMIETILTLAIFSMLQMSLIQSMHFGLDYYHQLTNDKGDDWANFILQVDREIRCAQIRRVTPQSMMYQVEELGEVTIEFYRNQKGGMLRRRVRGSGHQPLLMQVQQVQMVKCAPNSVHIACRFENGKQHQFAFYSLMNRREE